jgi:hypothetical protein
MGNLRTFIRDHRRLAALLLALALCIRALMPAGYMLANDARTVTVQICTDGISGEHTQQIVIHQQGGGQGESQDGHAKADSTCPWSGLAMASLGGADAVLLALALAFVLALGFAPVAPARTGLSAYLRPPLRGPPAFV